MLDERGFESDGDFIDAVKWACADRGIDYGRHPDVDADVVHRACASARIKHRLESRKATA
jgi:hypothetical protein